MTLTLPTGEKGRERARVQPGSLPERLRLHSPGSFDSCWRLRRLPTLPDRCGELAQLEPPAASSTLCLPAEIHGIIARSSAPVFSIGWALPLARSALKFGDPAL
jgi:hypothetical protein